MGAVHGVCDRSGQAEWRLHTEHDRGRRDRIDELNYFDELNDFDATTSSTTSSTSTTTSTTNQPAGLTSLDHHHKQKGTLLSTGGPNTATVLTSDRNDPLTSPLARSTIALDLGAGAIAFGLLEVRRRRRIHVVPAAHSVEDLLGRPRRRSGSV